MLVILIMMPLLLLSGAWTPSEAMPATNVAGVTHFQLWGVAVSAAVWVGGGGGE